MLRELLTSLLQILSMAFGALAMRWLLGMSTLREDMALVREEASWLWDHIQIPDWRDAFNMDRLRHMRRYHPDAQTIIVEGTLGDFGDSGGRGATDFALGHSDIN